MKRFLFLGVSISMVLPLDVLLEVDALDAAPHFERPARGQ